MESYLVHDQHVPYRKSLFNPYKPFLLTGRILLRLLVGRRIPLICSSQALEGGATESFKATKVTKPKAAKAIKPASDPKPKPSPTQPPKAVLEKKQKLVQETPDEPLPAKTSKGGRVRKICKLMSSLKLVDEPSAEDVLVEEPAYNEEEVNLQRALELSLKEQSERTQGSACPVVIREPDSGRFQPLPKVQGKGKEKVVKEQAAHDLLTLQNPKNKIPVDQFIFQRRTPMPAEASRPAESPSLDAELALTDSETDSDDEGQAGPNPGIQYEGQAGPNPGVQDKGQAGSNPSDATGSQPQSSHVVHARRNLEPMDLEATDALPLQNPEPLDEETLSSLQNLEKEPNFTDQFFVEKQQEEELGKTNAEAKVQSLLVPLLLTLAFNLKITLINRTLSSLQNLEKEPNFTDQFFVEKQQEEELGKTNAEAKVQSMVSVPIHQDTFSVPPMTTPVIDLTTLQSGSLLITSSTTTSTERIVLKLPKINQKPNNINTRIEVSNKSRISKQFYQNNHTLMLKISKPASDPKPKPSPTQPPKAVLEKKQKLVQETPDEPLPAKRSKGGRVRKICKLMSSLKLVDEPSAEDVLVEEPAYNEEEVNLQQALELSLKEQSERTQGSACPVVIREPDSGIFQPLPKVQGKGKEKVVKEQAAHDLLTLQNPKNKIPVDQFIFQRRTPMPAEASRPAESPSLDAELALTDSETDSDDEGQAGPNPGIQYEGQAGPNPSENLKLPYEDSVILEEPASSTRTLYSLQNLEKEPNFTDQIGLCSISQISAENRTISTQDQKSEE
nr:hypothetical protein [Tanacetum cinerariifolium]